MTKLISTWNRRKRHRYYFKRNLLTFFLGSWWATSLGLSTLSTLLSLSVGALTFPNWPEPDWWSSVLSCLSGPISHNFRVNSTRDTVQELCIQLRKGVHFIHTSFRNISNSSSFYNIPDDK